jgi:hypothetical protein
VPFRWVGVAQLEYEKVRALCPPDFHECREKGYQIVFRTPQTPEGLAYHQYYMALPREARLIAVPVHLLSVREFTLLLGKRALQEVKESFKTQGHPCHLGIVILVERDGPAAPPRASTDRQT